MSMFEEDYLAMAGQGKGFDALPESAREGLRSLCFAMWVKGAQRAQTAREHSELMKLAEDMLVEVKRSVAVDERLKKSEHVQ